MSFHIRFDEDYTIWLTYSTQYFFNSTGQNKFEYNKAILELSTIFVSVRCVIGWTIFFTILFKEGITQWFFFRSVFWQISKLNYIAR